MKKFLTLLLSLNQNYPSHHWWTLEETKHGDPPEERVAMYTYPQVLQAIRNKLNKWSNE